MDQDRHRTVPLPWSLQQINSGAYPDLVTGGSDSSGDIRRLRVDHETWAAYAEIVGDGGRSADLRRYIEWRLDNPRTPLPGQRRGPVKKVRKKATEAEA